MSTNVQEQPRVDRLVTLKQVAETYSFSQGTVRRLVRAGRLHPIRLVPNGRLRFRESDVQALIDAAAEEEDT
jgi:excisionase family DNA binding protein